MNNVRRFEKADVPHRTSESFVRQTVLLIEREFELMAGRPVRLLLLLALPMLCAVVVTLVVGDDMFGDVYKTQTGFFTLCCAVAFTGIFNSMQEICRERSIIRREYATDLRLDAYIWSKLITQTAICAVQSLVVLSVFSIKADMSGDGILLPAFLEYYITLFLLATASASTGLFISSVVRAGDVANTVAPVFLVMQILFSGMLVVPKSFLMKVAARLMVCFWALGALCSIGDVGAQVQDYPKKDDRLLMMADEYIHDTAHLLMPWMILLLISVALPATGGLFLRRITSDKR